MRKFERFKIGIGKYIEFDPDITLPALSLTPARGYLRFIGCGCGGRYRIENIKKCALCWYRGARVIIIKCALCGHRLETWQLPDGRVAIDLPGRR